MSRQISKKLFPLLASFLFFLILASQVVYAQVTVNILAVNGTERAKEKKIKYPLPEELKLDDILDTNGLKLEYDVNAGHYNVIGEVTLAPKESKTYKVRFRDVWVVSEEQIEEIKEQANKSVDRFKKDDFYERALERRQYLFDRLDYIVSQQEEFADNVEKRIDRHRIYAKEIEEIRTNALSIDFWRGTTSLKDFQNVVKFNITLENPFDDKSRTIADKHYLPPEVKPEHFVETLGFDLRYDVVKSQTYLTKEIELKPKETKRFIFEILDVWFIPQQKIEDLKEQTRKNYDLLKKSVYADTAKYLVKSIAKKLESVELSQKEEREIKEHISTFRANKKVFESAENDVRALEDLLNKLRENLERSRLKNILAKINQLKEVADVAEVIFKEKPSLTNITIIIIGIIVFVGLFLIINYLRWGKQANKLKRNNEEE